MAATTPICYDGSPGSKAAVALTAATISDPDVTLLHVWTPGSPELTAHRRRHLRSKAEDTLEDGCRLAADFGLHVSGRLEPMHGTGHQTILDVSEETQSHDCCRHAWPLAN